MSGWMQFIAIVWATSCAFAVASSWLGKHYRYAEKRLEAEK